MIASAFATSARPARVASAVIAVSLAVTAPSSRAATWLATEPATVASPFSVVMSASKASRLSVMVMPPIPCISPEWITTALVRPLTEVTV